ncbi:hypothetical protein [Nonlabens sp. YIK11]|uniref:hypothetical protein n=1 Tax=Nonlabens sp. YIK11 TaxID=1453349 RepID=UPI0012E31320|nr:hypothetical protein [Nonlabens sp. YIK11]
MFTSKNNWESSHVINIAFILWEYTSQRYTFYVDDPGNCYGRFQKTPVPLFYGRFPASI